MTRIHAAVCFAVTLVTVLAGVATASQSVIDTSLMLNSAEPPRALVSVQLSGPTDTEWWQTLWASDFEGGRELGCSTVNHPLRIEIDYEIELYGPGLLPHPITSVRYVRRVYFDWEHTPSTDIKTVQCIDWDGTTSARIPASESRAKTAALDWLTSARDLPIYIDLASYDVKSVYVRVRANVTIVDRNVFCIPGLCTSAPLCFGDGFWGATPWTNSDQVEVAALPKARISVHPAAVGSPTAFDGGRSRASGENRIVRYDWTWDDGVTMSGKKVARTYEAPGRHSVTLVVVDSAGMQDRCSKSFRIGEPPAPPPQEEKALYVYYGVPGWSPYSETDVVGWLRDEGFDADACDLRSSSLPDLGSYQAIVVHVTGGAPADEIPFASLLSSGKGVVVLEATLFFLGSVPSWSGASAYSNGGGNALVSFDHPFGTAYLTGDVVNTSSSMWGGAAAMTGLAAGATEVAGWGSPSSGAVFAYAFPYSAGRVYYQAQFGGSIYPNPDSVSLFRKGVHWAADGGALDSLPD